MNIEVSEWTVISIMLGAIALMTLKHRRSFNLRVSPKSLELNLDEPPRSVPDPSSATSTSSTNAERPKTPESNLARPV